MSGRFDSYGKQIRADGVIVLADSQAKRLFWSKETQEHACEWVTVIKPKREARQIRVLVDVSPTARRVIDVPEILDTGFDDFEGAKAIVHRMKLKKRLLEAQASIAAVLELLDHGFEPDESVSAAPVEEGIGLAECDFEGGVGRPPADGVEGKHVREQQLLQGSDLLLKFLDALRVAFSHGVFSLGDVTKRKRNDERRHRLRGDGK